MAEVDDEGDGVPSSVIASSLLRHSEKSYIKLEVISAKQIKNLILFFNIFVALAIAWTIITVALGNTIFTQKQDLPLPIQLVHEDQLTRGILQLPIPPASSRSQCGARGTPPTGNTAFPPEFASAIQQGLAAQGECYTPYGIVPGKTKPLPINTAAFRLDETTSSLPQTNLHNVVPVSRQTTNPTLLVHIEKVRISVPPQSYVFISHVVTLIMSIFFFAMSVSFGIRIYRQGRRHVSHEQVWVFCLIIITSLYYNPLFSTLRIAEGVKPFEAENFPSVVLLIDDWLISVRDIAFTAFSFFYLWVSLHSYRILDPTQKLGIVAFYLPKMVVLIPYVAFKVVSHAVLRMQLSEVPMMSGPAMLFIFADYNMWNYLRAEGAYCIAASLIEALLVGIIVYEAIKTTHKLENAPYMKYRTKRVGFRFFLYINFLFYPLFIALNCLLMFAMPRGDKLVQVILAVDFPRADVLFFFTLGPCVLMAGYVIVTAYVHLPCTSVGVLKGWFMSSPLAESGSRWSFSTGEPTSTVPTFTSPIGGSSITEQKMNIKAKDTTWANDEETPRSVVDNDDELERQIIEPITYRKRESQDSLELKANCFTMQTHVIMFNFAWYVYYYGTPKLDTFKSNATDNVNENPLPFEYKIARHVKSELTDTQALVVDCSDRIIITFKGTTSMRNLQTSLHMSHERLSSIVRTSVSGEDESMRLKKLFGRRYMSGMIHKGFAVAYRSVADEIMEEVRVLRERKQRPVFLTGHSLGGALATICSLDLWVKLDISRREIFVSTFGSPRVGNKDFVHVYKEVVPLHWRIVVDPDMIAKLPNVGYAHVGKKVVLTPHGDMFIDPNALEARPWTGERAVFAYHRKASYMLAMRAWCVRHHGMTYTPAFWPFPIRQEDERRFPGISEDGDIASERLRKGKVTSKIIHMDAMVDALGRGETELANMAVVEKWGRLTRRLLLQDKLISRA